MIGRVSIAAVSMCLGACASSGPEIPGQAAAVAPATFNAVPSGGQTSALGQRSSPGVQSASEDDFYALETPGVSAAAIVTPASMSGGIVCRRERATGTKFSRKVCRSRADIEARAEMDQKLWYQMRRNSY